MLPATDCLNSVARRMLHSAVALAEDGNITWTHVQTAQLTMRAFSPQFVGRDLAATGP